MDVFNCMEFNIGDIVRSGFIRDYLINKIKMGLHLEWNLSKTNTKRLAIIFNEISCEDKKSTRK